MIFVHLTDAGQQMLRELRGIAEQHETEFLAPLSGEQVAQLDLLLAQLADGHGLGRELHRDTARDVDRGTARDGGREVRRKA